jgi:hypothetical protein
MARFSHAFRTAATSGAVAELIGGTGSERVRLVELGITLNAQTLSVLGLGYPGAVGVTPSTPVTLLCDSDTATTTVTDAVGWATPPTAPTSGFYFRRATVPLAQNFPLVWTWPKGEGLLLLPSTSIVLYLLAAGSVLDGWWVVER